MAHHCEEGEAVDSVVSSWLHCTTVTKEKVYLLMLRLLLPPPLPFYSAQHSRPWEVPPTFLCSLETCSQTFPHMCLSLDSNLAELSWYSRPLVLRGWTHSTASCACLSGGVLTWGSWVDFYSFVVVVLIFLFIFTNFVCFGSAYHTCLLQILPPRFLLI